MNYSVFMAMAKSSLAEERAAINEVVSDDDISSEVSVPVFTRSTTSTSGLCRNMASETPGKGKLSSSTKPKEKSSSARGKSAKLSDLQSLESKLVGEIESRFQSFDSKFDILMGALSTDSVQRRSSNSLTDSGTLGTRRPPETYPNPEDTTNGGGQRISLDNGIDSQLGDQSHFVSDRLEDELSLQPGQRERHNIGLLSSEGSVQSEDFEPHISSQRFQRYTDKGANDINDPPLTHDILREMFGEDASTESHNNSGLLLDKTQIDIISSSLRSQMPDKLSAYKDSYKQSFPIQESTEKLLQVPSLDYLTERLLIKKHGRRATFGTSQSLFSQPYKSIEKIAFQGQVAARMGIISLCYSQQAMGLLLKNLKSESPNLDEAIQNVRDLFAMSTKSLDQLSRTGAFFHLVRRKATVADTGLHEFKDLQKVALTAPLSGEGIFGPDFEKKLKDRQEKDKQLSELMPEIGKKPYLKRKSSFYSESTNAKKPRNGDDSYSRSYRGYNYSAGNRRSFRGSHSSSSRGNFNKPSMVSSFRSQGSRANRA